MQQRLRLLGAGLRAAILARWPPDVKHPAREAPKRFSVDKAVSLMTADAFTPAPCFVIGDTALAAPAEPTEKSINRRKDSPRAIP
jgi:hypothetical protein